MEFVICPNCNRKHSILRKDGKLREKIHCRCRDWSKSHTEIFWLAGVGYHISEKNMDVTPALVVSE